MRAAYLRAEHQLRQQQAPGRLTQQRPAKRPTPLANPPPPPLLPPSFPQATEVVGQDTVREFEVIREDGYGDLTLSLKRLELGVAWRRLAQCMEEEVAVHGKVVAVNRGGLIVEAENIRGFCPGSQLGFVSRVLGGERGGGGDGGGGGGERTRVAVAGLGVTDRGRGGSSSRGGGKPACWREPGGRQRVWRARPGFIYSPPRPRSPPHPAPARPAQRVQSFEELMGKEMQFKVTEVDEEKMRLMLSNKRAAADERVNAFKVLRQGGGGGGGGTAVVPRRYWVVLLAAWGGVLLPLSREEGRGLSLGGRERPSLSVSDPSIPLSARCPLPLPPPPPHFHPQNRSATWWRGRCRASSPTAPSSTSATA